MPSIPTGITRVAFSRGAPASTRPRGATVGARPVPRTPASAAELAAQAKTYGEAIKAAGREQPTIDTYFRHAMFFVRWLTGEFKPGSRLRRRLGVVTAPGL